MPPRMTTAHSAPSAMRRNRRAWNSKVADREAFQNASPWRGRIGGGQVRDGAPQFGSASFIGKATGGVNRVRTATEPLSPIDRVNCLPVSYPIRVRPELGAANVTEASAMRAFVAVEIPPRCREAMAAAALDLARKVPSLRPTLSGNVHLTLRFLGKVPRVEAEGILASVRGCTASVAGFRLELRGVGVFPDGRRPRVLWAGCADSRPLEALAGCIRNAALAVGEEDDRPFRAHATIGRFRVAPAQGELGPHLEALSGSHFGAFDVGEVVLVESCLGGSAPLYRVAARLPLECRS